MFEVDKVPKITEADQHTKTLDTLVFSNVGDPYREKLNTALQDSTQCGTGIWEKFSIMKHRIDTTPDARTIMKHPYQTGMKAHGFVKREF